jgi:poly-gamma-glutamate synthesis protein (capsule biosynthesis protein)
MNDDFGVATLFLCGDVMTGRGVDQILAHPGDPGIFESYAKDAGEYVALAEAANGPVPRRVHDAYIWGDAIAELAHVAPRARIANLETSITRSGSPSRGKGIHYRMHPDNVGCLASARIDVCALANNHVLDFGLTGLGETLDTLRHAGIKTTGAGATLDDAQAPAVVPLVAGSKLIVVSMADASSGVLSDWGARRARAGVDLVHGHSSHHPRPIEVYRDRLILYGCGDFLNDYEGIGGHEQYRGDLALMFFPTLVQGRLTRFAMTATQIQHFRANVAPDVGVRWLMETLNREGRQFGTRFVRLGEHDLLLAS